MIWLPSYDYWGGMNWKIERREKRIARRGNLVVAKRRWPLAFTRPDEPQRSCERGQANAN
jgi:hypothetical protein